MNKFFLSVLSTVTAAAIVGTAACLWNLNQKLADVKTDVAIIKVKLGIDGSTVARK